MAPPQVWLIGGTRESSELAQALSAQAIPYVVTVTTVSAKRLYPEFAQVRVGAMNATAMAEFVAGQNIRCVLDASHPFATAISQQAIALCQPACQSAIRAQSIPSSVRSPLASGPMPQAIAYLRYERPALPVSARVTAEEAQPSSSQTITVEGIDPLLRGDLLHHQRVLLTIGYRQLSEFAPLRQTATLFARVLPSPAAIAGAIAAGFAPQEIIALRPPVSLALEKALWQQWNISRVVAKASGVAGGEATKRQAAAQLGVPLVLIGRPPMTYPRQTGRLQEAINFCAETLRVSQPNA